MAEETKVLDNAPDWVKDLLSAQQEQITKLTEKVGMLTDLAGKAKVEDWNRSQQDLTLKFATLKVYKGKVIIGWDKLDYTNFRPKAKDAYEENILIPLTFRDGTKESINYSTFINIKELITVQILQRNLETAKVKFDDGEEYEIKLSFLNS